jgi:putative ABC transport system ATP-binding protein
MSLVELRKISRTYHGSGTPVLALRPMDLTIGEGEFVGLTGPSGSGKSTLLAIVGAMAAPTSGRVHIDGIDVYSLSAEKLADFRREYLGFVFQQLYLVPYLTAAENVMLPLAAAGLRTSRQKALVGEALARVGLDDKGHRLPRDLSGGEQQRVAIARAIVNHPPLLLADEPTGCLDSATGHGIIGVFQQLQADGLTILMVTHDSTVAAAADRVVRLADGAVAAA